jgi:hypothetical protein
MIAGCAAGRRFAPILLAGLFVVLGSGRAFAQSAGSFNYWDMFQFFILFAVICWPISAWFWLSGRLYRDLARASQHWPTVSGKILVSEVQQYVPLATLFSSSSQSEYKYAPTVRYAFEVGGASYEGDTIKFGYMNGANPATEAEVLEPYPVGAVVTVHYDPANPKQSVLDISQSYGTGRLWAAWIMAGLPFIAVALLWWLLRPH